MSLGQYSCIFRIACLYIFWPFRVKVTVILFVNFDEWHGYIYVLHGRWHTDNVLERNGLLVLFLMWMRSAHSIVIPWFIVITWTIRVWLWKNFTMFSLDPQLLPHKVMSSILTTHITTHSLEVASCLAVVDWTVMLMERLSLRTDSINIC